MDQKHGVSFQLAVFVGVMVFASWKFSPLDAADRPNIAFMLSK
jgi:hypothetical protein